MERLSKSFSSFDEMGNVVIQLTAVTVGLFPQTTDQHGHYPQKWVHQNGADDKFHGALMVIIGGALRGDVDRWYWCGDTQ